MRINNFITSLPFYYNDMLIPNGFCWVQAHLQVLKERASLFLHPQEQSFLKSLEHHSSQHSYLLGRYCAKKSIEKYGFNVSPYKILVKAGAWGQPVVISSGVSNIGVSIAHACEYGISLGFPEEFPMGVDIEKINLSNLQFMKEVISSLELMLLKDIYPEKEEIILLTMIWTLKESLSKALKCGLTVPFHILETGEFKKDGMLLTCKFPFFTQYLGASYTSKNYVIGLSYPRQLFLKNDLFTYSLPN